MAYMIASIDQLKDIIEKLRNNKATFDERAAFALWLFAGNNIGGLPFFDQLNYSEAIYIKKQKEFYMTAASGEHSLYVKMSMFIARIRLAIFEFKQKIKRSDFKRNN